MNFVLAVKSVSINALWTSSMSKGNRKKKKKGRCPKCKLRSWNGKFCEARTDCALGRFAPPPTPRQRVFTNEFSLGDTVSVIRAEHGWHDGAVSGEITEMSAKSATVVDSETGSSYEINHPRDIRKT